MKSTPAIFLLQPSQQLTGVWREPYTKRRHGRAFGYLVGDRLGRWNFVGQKLPLICKTINEYPGAHDAMSKVSLNGLWQAADRIDGRAGPYCRGRWTVRRVDLDDVCAELEKERQMHACSVVCADELTCYQVGSVGAEHGAEARHV